MSGTFKVLVRKFEPFERITEEFWAQYAEKTGCGLALEMVSLPLPALHDAIMSGGFDAAHVNTDWLAECWDSGCLENLDSYIAASPPEDYPQGWADALLKLQTFPNGIAGIPFHDGPECLIYRKDLFNDPAEKDAYWRRYGADLKPPETWEEFSKAAAFFNRPEKGMYGTLFALYPDGHNNIFDFALQVWSHGGELTDKDGRITLCTDKSVKAMESYRKLIASPFIHPKSRSFESIGACWAFAHGEAAMMVNWFGFATMCETVEGSAVKGCVDICAVPHSAEYTDPVSLNVYYTWSVSAQSAHKQTAYDFIRGCVTKENDAALPMKGAIGCRKSTWFNADVNRMIPYYSRMDKIHGYARTLPRTPKWDGISRIIDDMIIQIVNTDAPVRDILARAQSQSDSLTEVAPC